MTVETEEEFEARVHEEVRLEDALREALDIRYVETDEGFEAWVAGVRKAWSAYQDLVNPD